MSLCLLAGAAPAEETIVSTRLLQLGGGEMPDTWVRVAKEKEPVKLVWLTTQPTEPLRVAHDGQLKLFRYSKGENGTMAVDDVRVVPLPAAAKEILLLGWESDGKTKYVALGDHFLQAKFDDWIAINTSSHTVALRAGSQSDPVRVGPGKSVIFQPKIEQGKGVEMIAVTQENGKTKTFLSTYWPAFAGQRTMIVFFDDGERMRAKRIGDRFVRKEEN